MAQPEYEYNFTDNYDDAVFSAGPVDSDEFRVQVQNQVISLSNILKIKPGIRSISNINNYQEKSYKITVINSLWTGNL